jgi:hypothetical protein
MTERAIEGIEKVPTAKEKAGLFRPRERRRNNPAKSVQFEHRSLLAQPINGKEYRRNDDRDEQPRRGRSKRNQSESQPEDTTRPRARGEHCKNPKEQSMTRELIMLVPENVRAKRVPLIVAKVRRMPNCKVTELMKERITSVPQKERGPTTSWGNSTRGSAWYSRSSGYLCRNPHRTRGLRPTWRISGYRSKVNRPRQTRRPPRGERGVLSKPQSSSRSV